MTVPSRAAAVVLAAGLGTRFGETPKLIAPLGAKPVLQHVLDTLHDTGIAPIAVVLGHASADVEAGIEWRDEVRVINQHPERGMLRSVLLGLRRLDQMWSVPERTLILLGDQPRLGVDQLASILASPVDEEKPFVVPRYVDGQPGNPVLLEATGRVVAQQFVVHTRKDTDRGLSQLFNKFPDAVRFVDVPSVNPDVDTPEDLVRIEHATIVARGYDNLAGDFLRWGSRTSDPARTRFVRTLSDSLRAGAKLLDLGCGAGGPSLRLLADRFDVTGVDGSAVQLAEARRDIPQATFIQADMAEIRFPASTFDAVTALYSIIHVPRDEHRRLFQEIARWLRPNGLFLASLSGRDNADWTGEWLGQPMFFSGFDAATNRRLINEAGFEILDSDEVELQEPERSVSFLWVLARRTEGQSGTT